MKKTKIGSFTAKDDAGNAVVVNVFKRELNENDPLWIVQFACAPLMLVTEAGETVYRTESDEVGVFWIDRPGEQVRLRAEEGS